MTKILATRLVYAVSALDFFQVSALYFFIWHEIILTGTYDKSAMKLRDIF
jgi:hypothetical protein